VSADSTRTPAWVIVVKSIFALGLWAGLPLISAWRIDWVRGWIYAAVTDGTALASIAILAVVNPAIIRGRGESHRGTKRFDKVILSVLLPSATAVSIVGGLDAGRFGWSSLPHVFLYVGIALHLFGYAAMTWVLAVNPFAEPTVRIQEDRGQHVITTGPYRYVRHPMYVGGWVMFAGTPMILGSAWAFVPFAVSCAAIVVRTAYEDRMLRRELAGYEEYAKRTRWRLVPGVW
jgi:protein-S-isoprenylcysteine O-methyltransferase Ste14